MAKRRAPKPETGDEEIVAGKTEHPRRMPQRDPYKTRVVMPERVNGYDVKRKG